MSQEFDTIKKDFNTIEKAFNALKFSEPDKDISVAIKAHAEGIVKQYGQHQRVPILDNWITNQLTPYLINWRGRYANNDQLLMQTQTEINNLEKVKRTEETKKTNLRKNITDEQNKLTLKQQDIDDLEKEKTKLGDKDPQYEKMKAMAYIIISIMVAIGTYFIFLNSQVNIKWATMNNADKVGIVIKLLKDGDERQYANMGSYLKDIDGNKVPLRDIKDGTKKGLDALSKINKINIVNAATPTLSQFVIDDPIILSMSLAALLLLLVGLATGGLYSRLNFPSWIPNTLYVLAVVIVLPAILFQGQLKSHIINKTNIEKQIDSINNNIRENKFDFDDNNEGGLSDLLGNKKELTFENSIQGKKLYEQLSLKEEELRFSEEKIAEFDKLVIILFMLAELIIGSIGWVAKEDYILLKLRLASNGGNMLQRLQKEYKDIQQNIANYTKNIESAETIITDANDMITRLTTIGGEILSCATIQDLSDTYLVSQLGVGHAILLKLETDKKESKSNG